MNLVIKKSKDCVSVCCTGAFIIEAMLTVLVSWYVFLSVLQAGSTRLNICAWYNGIGCRSYFVGFRELGFREPVKLRQIGVPTWGLALRRLSKLSWCSIFKTHNRLHPISDSQPDSSLPDYLNLINIRACLMKSGKCEAQIVKADYGCVYLNIWILEYLTDIRRGIWPRIKADYQVIFE